MLELVSVDDADADGSHKKISALLDEIIHMISHDNKQGKETKIKLKELIELTNSHFAYEERVMDEISYPFKSFHRASHKEILHILELLKKSCCNFEYNYYSWLVNSLLTSLDYHVKHLDVTLFTYKNYLAEQV